VEGSSSIRWERFSEDTLAYKPVAGAHSRTYHPTICDIGTSLRVAYTPVRADGVAGKIVFSKPFKVLIHPDIKAEVESNLSTNTLLFKVSQILPSVK
jgi:hypothetical protein